MSNVLEFAIDPDIELDGSLIDGMPDDIKGNLLAMMTLSCKKYKCHWTDLLWSIEFFDEQPIIKIKRKQ